MPKDKSTNQNFISRWESSGAAERANYQLFLSELCDFLDVPRPNPSVSDDARNQYVFERNIHFSNVDGSTSNGRIDLYLLQLAGIFPYYVTLWGRRIHPHVAFEVLAYCSAVGLYLYLRRRFGDTIVSPIRWAALAVAVAGAALGSKLLFLLEDPQLSWHHIHDPAYITGGKTIVGALLFGLIAVEAMKRYIGLKQSTGDLYAIPLALGIAIGRIGCFLTGLSDNTYGNASKLPWAINFGDGVLRHPTQLYEIAFLLALVPILYRIMRSIQTGEVPGRFQPGDTFKFFMVAYMLFRLLCDFIKPYPRILFGLGGIQWACLLVLLYYSRDAARWLQWGSMRRPASRNPLPLS